MSVGELQIALPPPIDTTPTSQFALLMPLQSEVGFLLRKVQIIGEQSVCVGPQQCQQVWKSNNYNCEEIWS